MPLTHDFKETILARTQSDPECRRSLLRETVEIVVNGELGPEGSPSAANLSSILTALQKTERVHFELSLK